MIIGIVTLIVCAFELDWFGTKVRITGTGGSIVTITEKTKLKVEEDDVWEEYRRTVHDKKPDGSSHDEELSKSAGHYRHLLDMEHLKNSHELHKIAVIASCTVGPITIISCCFGIAIMIIKRKDETANSMLNSKGNEKQMDTVKEEEVICEAKGQIDGGVVVRLMAGLGMKK